MSVEDLNSEAARRISGWLEDLRAVPAFASWLDYGASQGELEDGLAWLADEPFALGDDGIVRHKVLGLGYGGEIIRGHRLPAYDGSIQNGSLVGWEFGHEWDEFGHLGTVAPVRARVEADATGFDLGLKHR